MLIGDFYYEIPTSLPELNATSFYYVAFVFIAFCLARPFKSILRPLVIALANVIFLYSFGSTNLIVASVLALIAYISGIIVKHYKNKFLFGLLLIIPIVILVLFKYPVFNNAFDILMPLGLSFYTFKNISYVVDVYTDKINVQYNPIYYYDYACFFPCIVAGPINKAKDFFEDLTTHEGLEYKDAKNGGIQLLLGIFEKVVFSDYLAIIANNILNNSHISGYTAIFGVVLYSFVIYLDFDSYSNIAIGTARLFGIHMPKNFNSPYLGHNLKDFWSRWHISLSTFLKDYIYIPLGGNKKGIVVKYFNILTVFVVSGIWHGATINFVIWGVLHGLIRIIEEGIEFILKKIPLPEKVQKVISYLGIPINFVIVTLLWLVFRCENLNEVIDIIHRCMTLIPLDLSVLELTHNQILWMQIIILIVVVLDILRNNFDMLDVLAGQLFIFRWVLYALLIVVFLIFGVYGGSYDPSDFIYKWF